MMQQGRVVQALHLTREQQGQILTIRRNHLTQIREVFLQRQQLNMQVSTPPPLCYMSCHAATTHPSVEGAGQKEVQALISGAAAAAPGA